VTGTKFLCSYMPFTVPARSSVTGLHRFIHPLIKAITEGMLTQTT